MPAGTDLEGYTPRSVFQNTGHYLITATKQGTSSKDPDSSYNVVLGWIYNWDFPIYFLYLILRLQVKFL